jgi:hypothetical protein
MEFRDRITEYRKIKGKDLLDNDGNWRIHPALQQDAVRGIMEEVGIVGALLVYTSERQGGITVIDGHLRKNIDPEFDWPCLVTDLDDAEADFVLSVLDPSALLAQVDVERFRKLTRTFNTDNLAIRELLRQVDAGRLAEIAAEKEEKAKREGIPDMEILPFEHYDYIVLMFRNSLDFDKAVDLFGVRKVRYAAESLKTYGDPGVFKKVGLGRVVDGARALEILEGSYPVETVDLDGKSIEDLAKEDWPDMPPKLDMKKVAEEVNSEKRTGTITESSDTIEA